jgi:phosphatidylinositol alpha-1,6-mannosyltransferase
MHGIEVWQGLRPDAHRGLRNAALCLVNSNFTLRRFTELHGELPHAQVCLLATEEDEPPTHRPNFTGPPTVLILGRIDNAEGYKGHAELVAAWPSVVKSIPDARLLIVGGGPGFEQMRGIAAASPVAGQIEMTGFVPEEALEDCWRRAHIFAMPSRKEGFGLVYAEAMRYGLPIIASVHDAASEINLHAVTGLNVDLDRPSELPEALIALLSAPEVAAEMGVAGHERWRALFSQSAFRARLQPILDDFLGSDLE